jgi:hypothetical protein
MCLRLWEVMVHKFSLQCELSLTAWWVLLHCQSQNYTLQDYGKIARRCYTNSRVQAVSVEWNHFQCVLFQPAIIYSVVIGSTRYFDHCIFQFFVNIVPCWRYLLGDNRLSHSMFTLFIYVRLHRRYYTTVELELSNSRTLEPSTLEPSNCRLSSSLVFVDWLISSTLRLRG